MKKNYKKNTVIYEELLKNLITKYEDLADEYEYDILNILEGNGIFSNKHKLHDKRIKYNIYVEIYNDLLELQETQKDVETE